MDRAMRELVNQQYPAVGGGLKSFRERGELHAPAVRRKVDPYRHISSAASAARTGIAAPAGAVTRPGDIVLCPDPAYPVYEIGSVLALPRTNWRCRLNRAEAVLRQILPKSPAARTDVAELPSKPDGGGRGRGLLRRAIDWTLGTWRKRPEVSRLFPSPRTSRTGSLRPGQRAAQAGATPKSTHAPRSSSLAQPRLST